MDASPSPLPKAVTPLKAMISLWPHVITSIEKALAAGNIKELGKMHAIIESLERIRDAVKFLDGCSELAMPAEVPAAAPVEPASALRAVPAPVDD